MNKYLQTMEAMRYLAGTCDGARSLDGQGFNAQDSRVGKDLAVASATTGWTQPQMNKAIVLLQKYRRQLSEAGLELPKVAEVAR